MKVVFTPLARKQLQALGSVEQERIILKLDAYAADPAAFRHQVKKLRSLDALRLGIGDYRVFFNEDGVILRLLRVGHRREIYR